MSKIKDFEVSGLPEGTFAEVVCRERGDAEIYTVNVGKKGGEKLDLSKMVISFTADGSETVGRFYPTASSREVRATWCSYTRSTYMSGVPIYSYYRQDDANKLTVAVGDGITTWGIRSGIKGRRLGFILSPESCAADFFTVQIFVDVSERPYYEATRDAIEWWSGLSGTKAYIPESAYDPVYSTWYAFHREVDTESVLRQCEAAAKAGCKTVFLDDGWETYYGTKEFSDAGDWIPIKDKFPDFKLFVDRIHALGMKAVLWIAPFNSGFSSESAKRFAGKFLYTRENICFSLLDPRYPEIRETLIDHMCRLMKDYGFDGLKIDFIDSVKGEDKEIGDGRDFVSVSEALNEMLKSTKQKLTEINPDALIEFRQSYTCPEILSNANIVRSSDCAQDFFINRMHIIDLRLHTRVAVHADMIQMIENEPADSSALQMTAIMFSTPQVSVRFDELSEDQRRMIKFWLGFMDEKRELLQKSSFEPSRPYANFPSVTVRNEKERLTTLYGENILIFDDPADRIYVVNAFGRGATYLGSKNGCVFKCRLINCMGDEVECGTVALGDKLLALDIPFNGMAVLEKV